MTVLFKGAHFPKEIILMGVRWSLAYHLGTRHVEELMEERGVEVDHSTIHDTPLKRAVFIGRGECQTHGRFCWK